MSNTLVLGPPSRNGSGRTFDPNDCRTKGKQLLEQVCHSPEPIVFDEFREEGDGTVIVSFAKPGDADRVAQRLQEQPAWNLRPDGCEWNVALAYDGNEKAAWATASTLRLMTPAGKVRIARSFYEVLPDEFKSWYYPVEHDDFERFHPNTPQSFVVSPIGDTNSPQRERADFVMENFIKPACAAAGYRPVRGERMTGAKITEGVFTSLQLDVAVVVYLGGSGDAWNPNVMLEAGYRLATGLPVVFLVDEGHKDLPFDIQHFRHLKLPRPVQRSDQDSDGDSNRMDPAKVDAVVEDLRRLICETKTPASREDLPYPVASILFYSDPNKAPVFLRDSLLTRQLFGVSESLVNMPVGKALERVQPFFPARQYKAFIEEQTVLLTQLMNGQIAMATVPMVFERHIERGQAKLAFLPIIIQRTQFEDQFAIRVLYLDVSSATRAVDGIYRCELGMDHTKRLAMLDPAWQGAGDDAPWESYAWSYDEILPRLSFYSEVCDRHVSALMANTGNGNGALSILDLGAGTGNVAERLVQQGCRVHAVDSSHAMLGKLSDKRSRLEVENRQRLILTECPMESLDGMVTEVFDGVNILLVLFDVDDPSVGLKVAMDALKPGGVIVVTEPRPNFKLEPLLAKAREELQARPDWDQLKQHWETVEGANRALRPFEESTEKAARISAEDIKEIFTREGYKDIEFEESHLGNCATVRARKP